MDKGMTHTEVLEMLEWISEQADIADKDYDMATSVEDATYHAGLCDAYMEIKNYLLERKVTNDQICNMGRRL